VLAVRGVDISSNNNQQIDKEVNSRLRRTTLRGTRTSNTEEKEGHTQSHVDRGTHTHILRSGHDNH
jgi:hypothetical protein